MTLQDIWDHIYSRTNKDQSGNTYNPERFNVDLKTANIEMFSKMYGLPTDYSPGVAIPRVAYSVTQRVKDDLRHLVVNMGGVAAGDPGPLEVNSDGIAYLPEDYIHVSAMNYTYVDGNCNQKIKYPKFDVLTDQQWSEAIGNVTMNYRVAEFPYCTFRKNYIEVRPKTIQQITPVYDYYVDSNDAIIYLPPGTRYNLQPGETGSAGQTNVQVQSNSVELEWPVEVHPDICNLLLSYVADNLRSQELKQSAEMRKASGY
jgi:hypothetical protein